MKVSSGGTGAIDVYASTVDWQGVIVRLGGACTRSPGETKLEVDRRRIRDKFPC